MTRGVVLFAFNSPKYNYYRMAEFTAHRVSTFLKLPVTIITDNESLPSEMSYQWDNIITIDPDKDNFRDWGIWINKGRYQVYDLSPYDETLLLDVDYVINSDMLLKIFDFYDDFCCHNKTSFLMQPNAPQEVLSSYSFDTLWATVIAFKKTSRVKQIFECIKMIQDNYDHYANIHSFVGGVFRNDYALTLALRIVNGHTENKRDYIPWNLIHVGKNTAIFSNNKTEYTVMYDNWYKSKIKKEYIIVKDTDFHLINKDAFTEMFND